MKLNIIGAGKVAKTLGHLLHKNNCYKIQNILSRSLSSSEQAKNFIGSGEAITKYADLKIADAFLLAVNDDQLKKVVTKLAKTNLLNNTSIVFHCSGSLSCAILAPLQAQGAHIASLHPIKSFSQPKDTTLQDTFCTLEGDDTACIILQAKFEQLGATIVKITSEHKMHYHIATIFCSNYLVTLLELSLQFFEKAGINRQQSLLMLQPLILNSWQQCFAYGPVNALTGPIARGEHKLIAKQLKLLTKENQDYANLYQSLGKMTLELASRKGTLSKEEIIRLQKLLKYELSVDK